MNCQIASMAIFEPFPQKCDDKPSYSADLGLLVRPNE